MKRQPTSIPELPPSPRRKRALSEEERALWESVAKADKTAAQKALARKDKGGFGGSGNAGRCESGSPAQPTPISTRFRGQQPIAPPLAPLGRRERSQLSRGRKEIDARLDLHGMTQTRAHRELFGFLQRAHSDGLTFVLVITGKGRVGS